MAKPTSSSNRSKRKTTKPITTSKGRQNRSSVSTAKVTNSDNRGKGGGTAKVTTGKGATKPTPKALPPGTKGGPLATQGRTSLKGQPQLPPGRKGGSMEKAGPTVDVKANTPKLKGSTPKPSGNFKAPSIPKPTAAAPKPNALARNLKFGRGNVAAMILGAANAADDARLTPEQLKKKYEVVNPDRGQKLLTKLQNGTLGKPDVTVKRDPNGRSSTGVRVSDPTNKRDYQAAPTGSKTYNAYRDKQIADEKARLKNVGNTPKPSRKPAPSTTQASTTRQAPSMPRAVTPRQSSPSSTNASSSSPTLRKGADQDKNRGSYVTKFKEETGRMAAASMVRQQNRGNMTSEDLKPKKNDNIKTNYDGSTNVYEPKTKVNAPNYSKAKIDQKKVDEYGRRKKRYYD